MDISVFGLGTVAAITVLCYLAGTGVKTTPLDNKYIPVICGGTGLDDACQRGLGHGRAGGTGLRRRRNHAAGLAGGISGCLVGTVLGGFLHCGHGSARPASVPLHGPTNFPPPTR